MRSQREHETARGALRRFGQRRFFDRAHYGDYGMKALSARGPAQPEAEQPVAQVSLVEHDSPEPENASSRSIERSALQLIDPQNGLHALEWADKHTAFRWSGAWGVTKLLEALDRSVDYVLRIQLLALAPGVSADQISCTVDGDHVPLDVREEYGFKVLTGLVPRASGLDSIELQLSSPLVKDGDGGGRTIGFALVSIGMTAL
jgi:hypothetical protein